MATVVNAQDRFRRKEAETIIPFVKWEVFINNHFRWNPGEHIGLIGPTGAGKSSILLFLVDLHKYVVVVATKPRSRTLAKLRHMNFRRMEKWDPKLDPDRYPRRLLWPNSKDVHSEQRQRDEILTGLKSIFRDGGWTVAIDELWYLINILKLEKTVKIFLLQARELDISLLIASQRPAYIPLEVYDQSTHLFFWRDNDERNLSRISGISWQSAAGIRDTVANLDADNHHVLYINTRTGEMLKTSPPAPETIKGEEKKSIVHRVFGRRES
jgi:energy-coupling factor transporter ATP-binding protein EcfA2